MPRRLALTAAACAFVLSVPGCDAGAIDWEPVQYVAAGARNLTAPPEPWAVTGRSDPRAAEDGWELCGVNEATLGAYRYRAGWNVTAGLLVSMSADGGATWQPPIAADRRPIPPDACSHPPGIFADSVNRFLHLAYFSDAHGGPGVYYVHSMDAERLEDRGAGMFEQPVAIVYGERAVRTAVASRGDTVVVAYGDPNSPRGRIQLALSPTAGHSFDRIIPLPGAERADRARVELRAGEVVVTWEEPADADSRLARRVGRFR